MGLGSGDFSVLLQPASFSGACEGGVETCMADFSSSSPVSSPSTVTGIRLGGEADGPLETEPEEEVVEGTGDDLGSNAGEISIFWCTVDSSKAGGSVSTLVARSRQTTWGWNAPEKTRRKL